MDRVVILEGEIDAKLAMEVIYKLQKYDNASHAPIVLEINSCGGSVYDGLAIIDVMNYIESPVYTVGLGQASSMGSLILASGEKGFRKANRHCFMLLHQMSSGYKGKMDDLESVYESTKKLNEEMYKIYSRCTGMKAEEVEALLKSDKVVNGTEAKELGIVDDVVG